MDSEIVLEILFSNKSNQSFEFEKVLNFNNNLSDWFEFYRHNSFLDVLILFLVFLFYILVTQLKKIFYIESDSTQNDNKLVH
jgi:ascorbate-specific PTS system EIIC-type component UlaA